MRFYIKIIRNGPHLIKQSFWTFNPSVDYVSFNMKIDSPIINSLLDMHSLPNMGCGIGTYEHIIKIWVNQLEFLDEVNKQTAPFLNIKNYTSDFIPGILHYIGYFPKSNHRQIYYYLGTDNTYVDPKLQLLQPDYFGLSRTYDKDWICIKQNSYAVRVPYDNCVDLLKEEFLIDDVRKVPYLNLSYRSYPYTVNDLLHNPTEFAVNWSAYDTTIE